MRHDLTPLIGGAGTIGTAILSNIHSILSIAVGVASLGYVVTKWVLLVRSRRREHDED
jgi:hypothetical protein